MTKRTIRWLIFGISMMLLLLISILYFVFIRDWNRPVPFPAEEVKKITYFQGRSAGDASAVLNDIYHACGAEEKSLERGSGSFTRRAELTVTGKEVLSLEYTFWFSPDDPLFQDRPFQQIRASRVNVYIYPEGASLETWPSDHLAFASNREEVDRRMDENYGRLRPLYRLFEQKGKAENVSYFVTPYDRSKNEFYDADGNDGSAYAFLAFGEYRINLDEWTQDSKRYACMPIVLQDLENLFQNSES